MESLCASLYFEYKLVVLPSYVEYNWVETNSAEPIKSNDHLSRIQLCRMAKSAESTCAESSLVEWPLMSNDQVSRIHLCWIHFRRTASSVKSNYVKFCVRYIYRARCGVVQSSKIKSKGWLLCFLEMLFFCSAVQCVNEVFPKWSKYNIF